MVSRACRIAHTDRHAVLASVTGAVIVCTPPVTESDAAFAPLAKVEAAAAALAQRVAGRGRAESSGSEVRRCTVEIERAVVCTAVENNRVVGAR